MDGWIETCRSVVSPWECDITEHFTIAYYFDRLADAAATTAEALGLRDQVRLDGRRFDVRFARELRAGAAADLVVVPAPSIADAVVDRAPRSLVLRAGRIAAERGVVSAALADVVVA